MSRARFVHDVARALPPIPTPHGRHDFAIGAVLVGGAAAVAVGVWIYRRTRRPAADTIAQTETPKP